MTDDRENKNLRAKPTKSSVDVEPKDILAKPSTSSASKEGKIVKFIDSQEVIAYEPKRSEVSIIKKKSSDKLPSKKTEFTTIIEEESEDSSPKLTTTSKASVGSTPSLSGRSVSFSYPSSTSVDAVISLSEFRTRAHSVDTMVKRRSPLFRSEDFKSSKNQTQVGYLPVYLVCPKCRNFIITKVTRRIGCTVYFVACALCLIFPLCGIIPFLTTAVYDVHHWCPFCGVHIGVFKP